MNAFKILKTLVCWFGFICLCSCVKTDDFELLQEESPELDFTGNITGISAVKNHFNKETNKVYTFDGTNTYMEAIVVSSDESGNFYKELVVQDKASNPTSGILILVDDNSLYETFEIGRKIYVKLDGLSLWFNNGVLQLGKQNRGDVVAIPNSLLDDHLFRTTETVEIIPLKLDIRDFRERYKNLYIRLENVQFNRNLIREENGFTFAAGTTDEFDGERELESCETGAGTILSTSTFADFKSLYLPRNSGSLEGILTRDFYDDFYTVVINSPEAINFEEERCDPDFLKCGENTSAGLEVLLEENFTAITDAEQLTDFGWSNINVNGGSEKFEAGSFDGNQYIRISAFNTEETPLEAWLVSPALNLERTQDEVLSFEAMASYDNGTLLSVWVTNEYTGNPLTTKWIPIDATISVGPSSQYGTHYIKSVTDVSCLEGEVRFAFRYLGAAPDKTTTYDIDNIRLTGNPQ